MNVDKTNTMVFPKTKSRDICVKLNEMNIENVHRCRYLGIGLYVDDMLTCHTTLISFIVSC